MATVVFAGAVSHAPLINLPLQGLDPAELARVERFRHGAREMGRRIAAANPDVLVIFGPDHFRSLFYDLMPSFCVGVGHATSWGDWSTPAGKLSIETKLARYLLRHLLASGFDPAFSYDLHVDHGVTQPVHLFENPGIARLPIVPIVLNTSAPPLPTLARCHAFGRAIADAIEAYEPALRIAVIGSGGLSHHVPSINVESCRSEDESAVARLIYGRGVATTPEAEERRVATLLELAPTLAERINADWDRRVMNAFATNLKPLLETLDDRQIDKHAGSGGHELRHWVAAAGAGGDRCWKIIAYEPCVSLMTGMGVMGASQASGV